MKLRPPLFWNQSPSFTATLLKPLAYAAYKYGQYRLKKSAHHVSVPVLCCGNISVGGTGKTPLVLHLTRLLQQKGLHPHIITKGYGGASKRQCLVSPHDKAKDMGDEAILLARQAPTWRGKNRVLSAQNAIAQGADCLILDDGLQDSSLHKDFSILVIDGPVGLGNGLILPSGPLREPLTSALKRVQAIIILNTDAHFLKKIFTNHIPCFQAELSPDPNIRYLTGKQCIAFCGIGRPNKFFSMLQEFNINVIRTIAFPDHHHYSSRDIKHLSSLSRVPGTVLVTTEKDAVKLPTYFLEKIIVLTIDISWQNLSAPHDILKRFLHQGT